MSAQTLGDVAALGERRLIESFAFPVENKSFTQLLDISGRVIGLAVRSQWVTMAGKSSRSPDMHPQISEPAFIVIVKAQSVSA
jgi:hypothetical protein